MIAALKAADRVCPWEQTSAESWFELYARHNLLHYLTRAASPPRFGPCLIDCVSVNVLICMSEVPHWRTVVNLVKHNECVLDINKWLVTDSNGVYPGGYQPALSRLVERMRLCASSRTEVDRYRAGSSWMGCIHVSASRDLSLLWLLVVTSPIFGCLGSMQASYTRSDRLSSGLGCRFETQGRKRLSLSSDWRIETLLPLNRESRDTQSSRRKEVSR